MDILSILIILLIISIFINLILFYIINKKNIFFYDINHNEVGIIYKKISLNPFQPPLPSHQRIALQGEAGIQADTLPAGRYWVYWPWQYTIDKVPLIKVPLGEIGLVFAKHGAPIPLGRQLGRVVDCHDFQDARAFLTNGGQKGRQMGILTAGEYQINTALFEVMTSSTIDRYNGELTAEDLQVYTVDRDKIGIVTTLNGAPLPAGRIAGGIIFGHDNFQNGQKFIDGGGYKGLQEEFLLEGAYNLTSWFVKVKQVPLIRIPAGTVGVVIYDVEKTPERQARHQLVEPGNKGIWKTPLYPGRHAINTEVMSVVLVPTNPIALDWSNREKPAHNYDAKLRALKLRSKDGFLFEIEVTQIIRIKPEDAPQMILSIGTREAEVTDQMEKYPSIRSLVTKVLEPTIGSYFRNSAQGYEALDFHDQRIERQQEAKSYINSALSKHGVQGVDTLINEIDLSDELERIQKERKNIEKEHEKEKERQDFELDRIRHEVKLSRIKAQAEAEEIRIRANAEADVIRQRGKAEAKVLERILGYLGPEGYLEKERIEQLANIKLPETVYGHNGWLEALMTRMLGKEQEFSNEKTPDWLEKLIDFLNNNPTIFMALKSFNDSHNPNNLAEIFTPPAHELPSGRNIDDDKDIKIIIEKN